MDENVYSWRPYLVCEKDFVFVLEIIKQKQKTVSSSSLYEK